jgi:hypothetical protein
MGSTISHCRDGLPLPMKVRPDVSASLAAGFAYEPRLDVGQPDAIRPLAARRWAWVDSRCLVYASIWANLMLGARDAS